MKNMSDAWICNNVHSYLEKMTSFFKETERPYVDGAIRYLSEHPETGSQLSVDFLFKYFKDAIVISVFLIYCRSIRNSLMLLFL